MKRNWFYQIINHAMVKAFDCIIGISRCKNDHDFLIYRMNKIDSGKLRHFDIQKHQVNRRLVDKRDRINCIVECADKLQRVDFAYEILKQINRQRLVVYNDTFHG